MSSRPFLFAWFMLTVADTLRAAPPVLNDFSPSGVRRGETVSVTIRGSNLSGHPKWLAPFGFRLADAAPKGSDEGNWTIRLTVDRATPVGVYPVRVQTDEGLSNPLLFAVGQLPQVSEVEDNSAFERAQAVTVPAVIEGQVAGNDVDYFRFSGRKGQMVVIDAQCARIGSGVDPSFRLTTAARRYIGSADDSPGLLTDARLLVTLPEDDDYVIELSDTRYQGGSRPVYRLLVGAVPVAEEVYPIGGRVGETVGLELRGGTLDGVQIAAARVLPAPGAVSVAFRARSEVVGTDGGALDVDALLPLGVSEFPEVREPSSPSGSAPRVAVPVVLNGRIDPAGDEDRFPLTVTPGQTLHIEVEAAESGSALDGVLQVLGAKGNVLATADDTSGTPRGPQQNQNPGILSPDPSLDFKVPDGLTELTLALRDLGGRGGIGFPYRITVAPAGPAFDLALNDAQVAIPEGGTALVGVSATRRGFTGRIALEVVDPPAGVTVRPGSIAERQTAGGLTLSATPGGASEVMNLTVVGKVPGDAAAGVKVASRTIVLARQANLPTSTLTQNSLAAVLVQPRPASLDAPADPIEVTHGGNVSLPLSVKRRPDATGALVLKLTTPTQPGLSAAPLTIGPAETSGQLTVSTTTEVPLGPLTVTLLATGKLGGADQTLAVPAVTLNVVRPAEVELATSAVEARAGARSELKGKVVRKAGFSAPVKLVVQGLPAGVKAEPVELAADASAFTIPLVLEDQAAAATINGRVEAAFQVHAKSYPSPPSASFSLKILPAK